MSSRIGITLGDPAGIGPEIVAAAVARADPAVRARLVVFCDRPLLDRAFAALASEATRAGAAAAQIRVVDRAELGADAVIPGRPTPRTGRAQVAYLEAAARAARDGEIAGLVTAPISKAWAQRSGFSFPGHTEFLAARLGGGPVAMMFAGPTLRVALATVHIPLSQVAAALSAERIAEVTGMTARALARDFGVAKPRIGVVGLNPHAGEDGLLGDDEERVIAPAVARCRWDLARVAQVTGPLVPDVAFRQAREGRYDALVAMYHDQGLIPVKLIDAGGSVNVTLGLPIVRTSPDHGVAYDIAGTGRATADSFGAALALCVRLVDTRAAPTQP